MHPGRMPGIELRQCFGVTCARQLLGELPGCLRCVHVRLPMSGCVADMGSVRGGPGEFDAGRRRRQVTNSHRMLASAAAAVTLSRKWNREIETKLSPCASTRRT